MLVVHCVWGNRVVVHPRKVKRLTSSRESPFELGLGVAPADPRCTSMHMRVRVIVAKICRSPSSRGLPKWVQKKLQMRNGKALAMVIVHVVGYKTLWI